MLSVKQLKTTIANTQFEFSVELAAQQMLAVTGASGVGKSTFLNTLLGFQPATSGAVSWQGQSILELATHQRPFGVLFQKDNLFEHLSVERNLSFGFNASGKLTREQKDQLAAAAHRFQISDLLNKKCLQLSGGQQQRVALARVFLQNKPILLLDEPFSSLDPDLRQKGLAWVNELKQSQGTTIIMVTHHLSEVEQVADQILEGVSSNQWKQYACRSIS